ncbi:hypothetical protein DQW50_03475 [Halorubrum sp. 48-1-W]|uniref:DUF6517 family protein n=1 Tax=Halorubrum sp. 48-1-W TaxID=2249761 RepID=UPI000DCB2302|nr:DUF6517 family protein [Halorubrum sp. 48-1-W]RAW46628.1 hypothetical protein DQW50_03475 [Halorubrum sp. 48-1-W]
MYRRRLLGALTASGVVAATGCLGGDDGSYEFDAEPARVPDTALATAGYEGEEPASSEVDRTLDVAGSERRVSVTTWVASYEKPARASSLVVASTPNATVADRSVNPLVRADDAELFRRLLGRGTDDAADDGDDGDDADDDDGTGGVGGEDVDDLEEVGTRTLTVLGTETTVTTFATEVEFDVPRDAPVDAEGSVPALVHVATVEDGEDVIALVGVHPEAVEEGETLASLMEAVEH